jgi:L-alanine-DL-glutamate epimerase-like enolase superfamily enzyme
MSSNLKISSVDIYKANIQLKEPFRIAIMEIASAMSVFVKINTDGGIYGFGEANPTWAITGETQAINLAGAVDLARLLIGKDRRTESGACPLSRSKQYDPECVRYRALRHSRQSLRPSSVRGPWRRQTLLLDG